MMTREPFERDQEVSLNCHVSPFTSDERLAVDACFKTGKGKRIEWRIRLYSLDREGVNGFVYQNDIKS